VQQDINFKYTIRIPWMHGDTTSTWNEKCIYALETFGLPGDKYITHPNEDYMDFMFKDERDAIYFSLACL
jgi:hypothetical protein